MDLQIIKEWIERWKTKSIMSPEQWYKQCEMKTTLDDYAKALMRLNYMLSSPYQSQRDFANWYYNVYLPLYSHSSPNT